MWEGSNPWVGVDAGTHRLLPYLYRRVERHGVESPLRARLRGVYVRYWHDSLRSERGPLQDVAAMVRDGLDPVVLKGTALQLTVYGGDRPTRPATDVDVLIPQERLEEAIEWLEERGYEAPRGFSRTDRFARSKSVGLSYQGLEIDLNWRIHPFGLDPLLERRLMGRRVVVSQGGQVLSSLSPGDHLLHTLLHGSETNPVPMVRWILDSCLLMSELAEADWKIFVDEVARGGYRIPVLPMLLYLRTTWDAAVPELVLRLLTDLRTTAYGVVADWFLGMSNSRGRQVARVAFAHYLSERDMTRGHPWRNFPLHGPGVTWGALDEYARRRRRLSGRMT